MSSITKQQQPAKTTTSNSIQALPQHVVDQIAAGEVVQRPASVVKELVENSLDANSTSILVHYDISSNNSSNKLQVIDNGCGINRQDLGLAATRFATSKLSSVQDFDSLSSFGFRGEALASMSLVAKLELASRTAHSTTAFLQTYRNGKPTLASPKPQARKLGTTVTVSDLFYNLPHRQKSLNANSTDEYHKVLQICQRYAIHYPHVSFVCRRVMNKKQIVDLNTTMLRAVKDLQQEQERAKKEEASSTPDEAGTSTTTDKEELELKQEAAIKQVMGNVFGSSMESRLYRVAKKKKEETDHFELDGLVSDPSFNDSASTNRRQTQLVLFCNHRSVDSSDLKRRMEALYLEFGGGNANKPLLYLSIHVPPSQVDVNVHPSKKQVTLLYQDEIYDQVVATVRAVLEGLGQTFRASGGVTNPYKKTTKATATTPSSKREREEEQQDESTTSTASTKKPKTAVSKTSTPVVQSKDKIRTTKAAPAGALEPFLVVTSSSTKKPKAPETDIVHEAGCPLFSLDLTNPGAFAQRCTCTTIVRTARIVPTKVPKISPSACTYKSILSLRKRIIKHGDEEWKKRLRKEAIFVGHVSEQRCLVQCGVELQEWHFERLAQILFQQLALLQFGGMLVASIAPVNISQVVGQLLELEELLSEMNDDDSGESTLLCEGLLSASLEVREIHQNLANQVATCLLDRAEMLDEYFSVGIDKDESGAVILSGLPVILPHHQPQPSGLPLFLLRLATEVTWDEEKPCFQAIAKELGLYYGQGCERHQIFPAICQLLVPPKAETDECFTKITQLAGLYKVFERG